ncbi:AAA family ATPase [Bremerella cremea]|uniref:AAA family ATPase n=1 Tax=Bremerella cremea TaxID=1031537 RepID=UPI0031E63959
MEPTLYVIAGPNGAGKTTFAARYLPTYAACQIFLNADLIALALSHEEPETQNYKAARLMLQQFDSLVAQRATFSIETTLSGRNYLRRFKQLMDRGYTIELSFLWLPDEEIAVSRVRNRVRQGGHNIPEPDIRRRYKAGLRNFFREYGSIVTSFGIYNSIEYPPELIAKSVNGLLTVKEPELFAKAARQGATL